MVKFCISWEARLIFEATGEDFVVIVLCSNSVVVLFSNVGTYCCR